MMVSSKQEIKCPECGQRLNVPLNYTGLVRCPACKAKTPVYEGSVQSEEVEVHSEETPVERELELFESDSYMIRKQVFTWFYSANFYIYSDESMENLIGFSGGWRRNVMHGEATIYSDESMSTKLLGIKQENILDSMAVYSIADRQTGEELGSMKRMILESVLKESWIVVDSSGNEVGTLSEDSVASAMFRRFGRGNALSWLAPKKYVLRMDGAPGEVTFSQKMNPVVRKWTVSGVLSSGIDPRLAVSAAILLTGLGPKDSFAAS